MVVCGARHTAGVLSSGCMSLLFFNWSESFCVEHALARTICIALRAGQHQFSLRFMSSVSHRFSPVCFFPAPPRIMADSARDSATMEEASVQARFDSVQAALRQLEQLVASLQSQSARCILALQEIAVRVQDLQRRLTVVETWGMGIHGLSKPPPKPLPRSLVERHSALAMAAFGISATASSSSSAPCTSKGPPPPSPRRSSSRSRSRERGRR
jgi:hypothetical protein